MVLLLEGSLYFLFVHQPLDVIRPDCLAAGPFRASAHSLFTYLHNLWSRCFQWCDSGRHAWQCAMCNCAVVVSEVSRQLVSGVLTRRSRLDIMYSMSPALRPVSLLTRGTYFPSRRSWLVRAGSCLPIGRMLNFDGEDGQQFLAMRCTSRVANTWGVLRPWSCSAQKEYICVKSSRGSQRVSFLSWYVRVVKLHGCTQVDALPCAIPLRASQSLLM